MPLNPDDQKKIVDAHNAYRQDPAVNAPLLAWDSTLATGAQAWADNLATNVHSLVHSQPPTRDSNTTGENIASRTTPTPPAPTSAAPMVDFWGKTVVPAVNGRSEQAQFKPGIYPNVTKDGQTVGHYTQMIWGTTTKVGCGIASDSTNGTDYFVCRYQSAGNMSGVGVPYPQPVSLAQVSWEGSGSGASSTPGGTVWQFASGVDAANNVYSFTSTDGGTTWTQNQITGKQMKMVSLADDLTLCGLDTSGAVWQCSLLSSPVAWPSSPMAAGPVAFRSVSCGSSTSIAAMGTDNFCYQNLGSGWTKMATVPGPLGSGTLVSVASDTTTVASDGNGLLYQYNTTSSTWQLIDGGWGFRQFSCGSATNIWGVDMDGKFWKYTGGPGSSRTQVVPGSTGKQISVASDGTAWSIGTDTLVYRLVSNAWTKLGL